MTADRPLLGISLMLCFCAIVPLSDGLAKLLGDTIPLIQLLLVRFTAQWILLLPVILATARPMRTSRRIAWLIALRTTYFMVGMAAMFTALRFLPLADAVAIAFVAPVILLLLGRFVLDEHVGPRRLTACVVGFGGTLLVIQPSFEHVGWPALLPVVVAVVLALYMLVSRQLAKDYDPLSLQATTGMMATAFLVLVFFIDGGRTAALQLKIPDFADGLLLVALGVVGTVAHVLMTWSLRYAPSATLAPMQYLEIPFTTLVGWLFFHDLPGGVAALGIVIIVASGLYIVYRERRTAELVPPEA